ncbi:F-box domain [Arabidopsis suecica]|nr:F-box domain [Arabidopsis suecica]
MEQRLRIRLVMGRDRISELPDALLLKILSFLPTNIVVATSVLSKQWRSLWKLVPNLEFDSEDYESEHYTFSEIVCKSFNSHKAPVLESFRLQFGSEELNFVDIGLWVGIAFSRHLRELVLDFYPAGQETFTFPSSLCTCNTLETLKLVLCILVDISSPVVMKSLRTLHLEFVTYKDESSIRNLLSGCPGLEELRLYRGDDSDMKVFTIEVPSLQRLTVHDNNNGPEFLGYLINAPSLKYLLIEELGCPEFCLNAPELMEAYIGDVTSITNDKFLGSLTSVKRLLLNFSPLKITYPTGSIFYQLISLEMYTREAEWWNLLTLMLENSPKLQALKLTDRSLNFHKNGVVGGKWNEPKYVPECLLSHLETFVWRRFDWGREEEKEIATYILKNARLLKKATFSTNPIDSEEHNKLKERRKGQNTFEPDENMEIGIGWSLFSHKAPVLESFHVKFSDKSDVRRACDDIDIGIWTGIAFERHVRELVLDLGLKRKWNEPKNVPECLLSQLKMFVRTSYHWESEVEKEVATYILKNARQLKNLLSLLTTMEQRSRNLGFVKADMMNQLPEALILRILSFLPTKTVITTSVLSKQWRSLWKLVPNLEFDSEDYESEHHTFSENVCKFFLSHKAPVLESLHLKFRSHEVSPVDIGLWVGIAFARHLRELVLHCLPQQERFTFPSSLCTCNTLETLKLKSFLVDIPSPVLMKSLKTLHLEFLEFTDDESICNLLSGCPILEDLVMDRTGTYDDVVTFTISVPSLQRLWIRENSHGEGTRGYMINVPSLKLLEIEGLKGFDLCLNAPELVEAYLFDGSYIITEKFLGSLKAAKHLSLDLSPPLEVTFQITYPIVSIFYQLVSLEIGTRKAEWWNLLTLMLDNSPKLQVLKLIDEYLNFNKKDGLVCGKWNEPKYVPKCLLSHLETFAWTRYSWEREEEKEVATYILKNARRLKKATFSTNPIESKELNKISELPEELLLKILSLLPTKTVISTSVLSKRWRSLWKLVPKLEFDSQDRRTAENVGRSLLLHKAPVLESLHLTGLCDDIDVGLWAGIAFARNVREFVLQVWIPFSIPVTFPSSLFYCDTLETLKLKNPPIEIDVPSKVSMKSLRTLHLEYVTYKDDDSICNLLSGCPNLEDLLVHRGYPNNVMNFVIVVPSLKRLSIKDFTGGRNGGYVINAPSLKYLQIERLTGYELCPIEDAPELVEANIRNVSNIVNEKILGSLKSAKRLSLDLSPLEIKCPAGAIFYQLVCLEMYTHKAKWWNLLTIMLDSSPKLQVLKLIDQNQDSSKDGVVGGKWKEPKRVPECLLSHLETFVWTRYDWRREEEKVVAKYILRNARRLNKATFSTRPIESKKKLEMLNEMNGVVKASYSCHLVGKDRISELPEELLLKILSLLPTKTVITTSVLSKRWRSLWKMVHKLKFESDKLAKFSENVGKFLLSYKAPVLESLHIKVTDKTENRCGINVGVWLGIAVVRHVRELVLGLSIKKSVRFPSSVFFCDTLETLKLKYSIIVDVPSPVCMKSLRTLHLHTVGFKDYESIRNLIAGCPNLEDLAIHRARGSRNRKVVLTVVIAAPYLKRLSIDGKIGGLAEGGYVINAPSLEYLKIRGIYNCGCCLIENAPVLVEATISNVSYILNEKILGSLKSAKRLSLDISPLEIKCHTGAIFYRLVYLEMHTCEAEWWNLLTIMLDSSPKLQVLKLIDHYQDVSTDDVVSWRWNEPKYVPECLLSHLETFVWIRYDWEREEEKEVATYILNNARLLKKATFSTNPIESKEKLEMLNEFTRMKASNSCHAPCI